MGCILRSLLQKQIHSVCVEPKITLWVYNCAPYSHFKLRGDQQLVLDQTSHYDLETLSDHMILTIISLITEVVPIASL